MAASVRFEILKDAEQDTKQADIQPPTHSYALRSRTSPSGAAKAVQKKEVKGEKKESKLRRVLRRRSRVRRGVCGDVKVKSTRKRVVLRLTAIHQKEIVVPPQDSSSSPTHIVIKTNPLFDSLPSQPHPPPPSEGQGQRSEVGVANEEAFYGQRRKIRKTKEQEMISAVMDVTKHSKKKHRKASLLQKLHSLGARRGTSTITVGGKKGCGKRSPLTTKNSNTELYHMLTQI